jgi:hypothetical protein
VGERVALRPEKSGVWGLDSHTIQALILLTKKETALAETEQVLFLLFCASLT